MAKPTVKATKTAPTPEIAPAKASRRGGAVLVYKSASEIKDLIGADVKIGVSKKSLTKAFTDAKLADALADSGI